MGLFSGSFGTGLITGLATSVDKSLRNAMDKRDDEMSSARKFWQQRQAQKLDLKEQHDRRATAALDRLIREADGDVALGLAAYQAAGNDPDSVESYLAKIDAVRDAKGTFVLKDNLILPKDYKPGATTIDRSAADASVLMELKGVTESQIGIDDSLTRIGLGLKGGAAKRVADKVNALIPPSEVTQVEGLKGVQLDMSNMLAAEEYARGKAKFEKEMSESDNEMYTRLGQEIDALDPSNFMTEGPAGTQVIDEQAYAAERDRLVGQQTKALERIAAVSNAKEAASGGLSASIYSSIYKDGRSQALSLAGIVTTEGRESYLDAQQNRVFAVENPDGFIAAKNAAIRAYDKRFIETQSSGGGISSNAASFIASHPSLANTYRSMNAEADNENAGKTVTTASGNAVPVQPPAELTQEERDIKIKDTYGTAGDYVTATFQNVQKGKTPNPQKMFENIMRIYQVSAKEAQEIIDAGFAQRDKDIAAAQAAEASKPRYKTAAERQAEEELAKKQREAQQSSAFSFSAEG